MLAVGLCIAANKRHTHEPFLHLVNERKHKAKSFRSPSTVNSWLTGKNGYQYAVVIGKIMDRDWYCACSNWYRGEHMSTKFPRSLRSDCEHFSEVVGF